MFLEFIGDPDGYKKISLRVSRNALAAVFAVAAVATTSMSWAQTASASASAPTSFTPISIVRSAGSAHTFIPVLRKADAKLFVTPDRADWTYALGAKASVEIKFDVKPYPEKGIEIKYKLGPDMREGGEKTAVVPAEGLRLEVTSPTEAGFMRCIVTANLEGKSVREMATLGFSPENIIPTQTEPKDFDAFWAQQKSALDKIAPDYQLTPAPKLSTERVEVFYLSFQNVGNYAGPGRFYGVLAVPRGEGPFPILLNVPGAGVRGYQGNLRLAERGVITLQVGIHGIAVNLPDEVYEQLSRGALSDYAKYNLDDRYSYYYRRVHLGVLRAADYLATLPKWDRKNFIVAGSSQGAQLSIMTAALDPRVTAIAANYPAYSDVSGYIRGRTGGWPNLFKKSADGTISDQPTEARLLTTSYYDTVNFARRVKVPAHFFFGYNDDVTAPTSTFAAYNTVTSKKQLLIAPEQGHTQTKPQGALIDAWILENVGMK